QGDLPVRPAVAVVVHLHLADAVIAALEVRDGPGPEGEDRLAGGVSHVLGGALELAAGAVRAPGLEVSVAPGAVAVPGVGARHATGAGLVRVDPDAGKVLGVDLQGHLAGAGELAGHHLAGVVGVDREEVAGAAAAVVGPAERFHAPGAAAGQSRVGEGGVGEE